MPDDRSVASTRTDALVRDFEFDDFKAAMGSSTASPTSPRRRNHHPDILVHGLEQGPADAHDARRRAG